MTSPGPTTQLRGTSSYSGGSQIKYRLGTGYADSIFALFSVPPGECRDITLNCVTTAPSISFPINRSLTTYHFDFIM
jgi:hypothetical protein